LAKRTPRAAPARSPPKKEAKPAWPADRDSGHSGEGSASALEVLHKLEKRRAFPRPPEPHPDDGTD
jgi:hypothetical protein